MLVVLLWATCLAWAAEDDDVLLGDILDPNLLPASLLLADEDTAVSHDNVSHDNFSHDNFSHDNFSHDNATAALGAGDFSDALHTMRFHRMMMNEYLCRSYVAGQILGDVMASANPRAEKRVGSPAPADDPDGLEEDQPSFKRTKEAGSDVLKDSLLMDPGSSKYKKWLARSKTLEAAYRQFEQEDAEEAQDDASDYDGVLTGLTYSRPFSPGANGKITEASFPVASYDAPVFNGRDGGSSYGGGGSSYGGGGSSYGGGGGTSYGGGGGGGYGGGGGGGGGGYGGGGGGGGGGYGGGDSHHEKAGKGGPSKSEIINMVMTAMAFMAFAMFKMNVVMSIMDCLTSTEAPAPAPAPAPMIMVMPPVSVPSPGGAGGGMFMLPGFPMGGGLGGGMMGGAGGGGPAGGGGLMGGLGGGGNLDGNLGGSLDGNLGGGDINVNAGMMGGRRRRRSVQSDVAQLDGIARQALESLEAFHLQDEDGGHCFRLWLCEGNSFSRQLDGPFRAWLPLWSFGLSWAAGRGRPASPAMLENLRAAVLGLGAARCDLAYPRCSARDLAARRRTRQRRRRSGDHAR